MKVIEITPPRTFTLEMGERELAYLAALVGSSSGLIVDGGRDLGPYIWNAMSNKLRIDTVVEIVEEYSLQNLVCRLGD